jgi:two-component system cell cycle response regulator
MMSELQNRAETMARFGVDGHDGWPDPVTEGSARVLLVRMQDSDAETIEAALRDRADVETADDPVDALRRLASPEIEAVVVAGSGDAQDLLDFCDDIRSTPTLFHLPLLLVFPPTAFADLSIPYRQGASEAMKMPFRPEDLRTRLFMHVKNERLRRRMLDAYRGSVHRDINDKVTGLFNEEFLNKHLEFLVEDAFRWDKNLSVTVIDLPAVRNMRREHGSELADQLLKQVGGVISRLVRGEDLCARLGDDSFCVVLPESPLEAASVTVQRLSGVVSFTDFALPDLNEPVIVQPRLGNTTFKPGDTAAGLLSRAQDAASAAEAA